MKNIKKSCNLILLLTLLLFIVSVSSVSATDTDLNCSLSDTVNTTGLDNNNYCSLSVNDSNLENINNNNDVIYDDLNDNKYCCGAIAFQSVLKENGINISLEESNKAVNSVNGSTSMQGLIDGARKYNLTAYGVITNTSNLQKNFIVHMTIDGTDHWSVVKDITNDSLILANSNLGDIKYDLVDFNNFYNNYSVIILNNSCSHNDSSNTVIIDNNKLNLISGNGKCVRVVKELKWSANFRYFKNYNFLKLKKIHYKTVRETCYKVYYVYKYHTEVEYVTYKKVVWKGYRSVPIWTPS